MQTTDTHTARPDAQLVVTQGRALSVAQSLPTNTLADLVRAGELLAQSGMFGIANAASGFVVAATCHQQGISLMEFQRTYHIVEGRPSMRADAMLAEFRKMGGRHRIVENSATRAEAVFEVEGQTFTGVFTIGDAQATGDCYKTDGKTLKHTWAKRPADMLWARMVSRSVRRLCPEIVAGLYTPEEAADFDEPRPARTVTPEIAPDVAAARATGSATVPATATPAPAPVDFTVCPAGFDAMTGVPWADMDADTLRAALECNAESLTHTHRAAIRVALEQKGGAA